MHRILLLLVCLLAGSLAAFARADEVVAEPTAARPGYRVGAGDVLKVDIYDEPTLSGVYPVDEGGALDLPLLGKVPVAGRTLDEVADTLTRMFGADYLVDPQVTVSVAHFGSQQVQVLGAVGKPGVYPLSGPTTLLDILTLAGGTTETSAGEVRVQHAGGEGAVDVVKLDGLLSGTVADLPLRNGDLVYVPERVYVYVAGEVNRPGPVPWRDGLTVSQAITAAGGATSLADLRRVIVLRDGKSVEVNLKRIIRGREADRPLQPEDQVHVGRSVL